MTKSLTEISSHPSIAFRTSLSTLDGRTATTRWGLVLVTQTGVPRATTLRPSFLERLFSDADGVAPYYFQISGQRQVFGWRAFGPFDMYTPAVKAEMMGRGAVAEAVFLRQVAQTKGVPVNDFDHFLWAMDPGAGGGTSAGGDLFIDAADLTPQSVAHEIGHSFGVVFEGDVYDGNGVVQTYGDSFCPMDRGPSARSFQNSRMDFPADGHNHQTTGPVMCAAHTFVMGWLDVRTNVVQRPPGTREVAIVLDAFAGAPPPGIPSMAALTIGPVSIGGRTVRFWIEYRAPSGFDRGVDRPVSTNNVDMPRGALVIHEHRPDNHVILVGWVAADIGARLKVPGTDQSVEITNFGPALRSVTLRLSA